MAQTYGRQEKFSMFASHSRWDGGEVRKLVPNAFSLTILRDPVDSFESWFGYSHQEKVLGISLSDFVQRLAEGDTRDGTGGRNRMLWDLGVARRDMYDQDILRQRIDELDREFDQVLILERLDEGLVMLADNLCWPLKQVVTGKLNARSPDRVQKLEGEARKVVAAWLSADYLLYNHFLEKHERNAAQVKGISEKLSQLRLLGKELEESCEGEKKREVERCRSFFRKEREYTRLLQMRNRLLVKQREREENDNKGIYNKNNNNNKGNYNENQ